MQELKTCEAMMNGRRGQEDAVPAILNVLQVEGHRETLEIRAVRRERHECSHRHARPSGMSIHYHSLAKSWPRVDEALPVLVVHIEHDAVSRIDSEPERHLLEVGKLLERRERGRGDAGKDSGPHEIWFPITRDPGDVNPRERGSGEF